MKRKPKILFVAEDAGGANALAPVYRALHATKGIFHPHRLGVAALRKHFSAFNPDLLVTAPGSWGNNMDKRAMALAKKRGIPTVSVVDFWSRYAGRFSTPGTRDLSLVPDVVCAIDETCRKGLMNEGIDPKRIVITGNPHFETFATSAKKGSIITFFCQPFTELKSRDRALDYGIDERVAFADLVVALDKLGVSGALVLKLHPRTENVHKFDRIIARSMRNVVIDRTTPSAELIALSSLVLGMHSMALFEAALAGKRVLSYQPGLNRPDPLISNTLGLSVGVTQKKKLVPALKRLLSSKSTAKTARIRAKYVRSHATRNVLRVIKKLL